MPLSAFNPFVERKKPRENADELAAVRAAAWAWFQHGSGSEPKLMREFGVTRTCKLPKPSRYRLEAMRIIEDKSLTHGSIYSDNSLLDKYEIDSISRQLSGFLGQRHDPRLSLGSFVGGMGRRQNLSSGGGDSNAERKKTKHKKTRGLWPRNLVICGKTEDVVDRSFVSMAKPTPRRAHA